MIEQTDAQTQTGRGGGGGMESCTPCVELIIQTLYHTYAGQISEECITVLGIMHVCIAYLELLAIS